MSRLTVAEPEADSKDGDRKVVRLEGWRKNLRLKANGRPESTILNAHTVLTQSPDWAGVLGLDLFRVGHVFLKPPPWESDAKHKRLRPMTLDDAGNAVRLSAKEIAALHVLTESDYDRACIWLEREVELSIDPGTLFRAFNVVAESQPVHQIQRYLNDLTWDGTPRAEDWLVRYAGAPDNDYTRAVGRWWLVSAVARAYRPGCKADHCLILEGPQGVGKSSLFKALTGSFFFDSPLDLSNKDSFMALRGQWVIEFQELADLNRHDEAKVKHYITTATDQFRPPYGRTFVQSPRSCVFAGTVNKTEYLRDETGARRFWPVRAGVIDVGGIARDRDQLWAEAVHLFNAGERWHPATDAERALCAEQVGTRHIDHPWTSVLEAYLDDRIARHLSTLSGDPLFVTLDDLFGAVNKPIENRTEADELRISKAMVRLGWSSRRRPSRLDPKRRRAYFPPNAEVSDD